MAVETATYVSDLNASYPAGGEPVAQGDDHLRMLKRVLQETMKGLVGPLQTAATGSMVLPKGTTAQRDVAPAEGWIRYNSDLDGFEGYTANGWGSVGGGQMLGITAVKAIFFNNAAVDEDVTVATGTNGGSFGPIAINPGKTVTVQPGAVWSVV